LQTTKIETKEKVNKKLGRIRRVPGIDTKRVSIVIPSEYQLWCQESIIYDIRGMSILTPREWQKHYQGSNGVSAKRVLMRMQKKIGALALLTERDMFNGTWDIVIK